jgi:DNA-binding MarR family transcriptional regulator
MTDDPLAFQLFNEIAIIEHLSRNAFAAVLPPGMTPAQFTVLNHFVRLGHASRAPAQLARAMQVTRATMTSTLARMVKAGLVTMDDDPADGRGKLVALTAEGRAMRERCLAATAALLPLVGDALTEAEQQTVLPLLAKLRERLDTLRDT